MKANIALRLFTDSTLTGMHSPEKTIALVKDFLKPWMKLSVGSFEGVPVCVVTVSDERDPTAAFCSCLDKGFLTSSSEELARYDMAKFSEGYYDFFDLDDERDVSHSQMLRQRAKYLLQGFAYHTAFVQANKDLGVGNDHEELKRMKPRFVDWLMDNRSLTKQEAIKYVNRDLPELFGVSSEYPKYPEVTPREVMADPEVQEKEKKLILERLGELFGPEFLVNLGIPAMTDQDYDKLFNN